MCSLNLNLKPPSNGSLNLPSTIVFKVLICLHTCQINETCISKVFRNIILFLFNYSVQSSNHITYQSNMDFVLLFPSQQPSMLKVIRGQNDGVVNSD